MAQNIDKCHAQKETKKTSETIARFVFCQRCTNCFQRSCTTHCIPDLIKFKPKKRFRLSYQGMDHLATYRMIEQKFQEWGVKMWVATNDFMKAFDSITHNSFWNALKTCGIEQEYISLLKRSCRDQKATVMTDKESDIFEIKRRPSRATRYRACSSTLFCRWLER